MPRKTPVRELVKEEAPPSSPLRRSSRLTTSSPVPTKVVTRRNSASEAPVSTPKATRGRRSSLSQEENNVEEKKKPTSTIRTRRSSLTQNNDDQAQSEPSQKPKTRGSSAVLKEPVVELKRLTRSRTSISEEPEEASKKITRSRSGSITKKNETDEETEENQESPKDVTSTPIKKSHSSETFTETLGSIEEAGKEENSPSESPRKLRRKTLDVAKIDFDLSVIDEASMTEEEATPQKKQKITENSKESLDEKNAEKELNGEKGEEVDNSKELLDEKELNGENGGQDTNVKEAETVEESPEKNTAEANIQAADSITSDVSFNLQLSSSIAENTENETNRSNTSDKENISPEQIPECEPMDVDDSSSYEIFSPKTEAQPLKAVEVKVNEFETKLQVAEKMNDQMAQLLAKEIHLDKEEKQGETTVTTTTVESDDSERTSVSKEAVEDPKEKAEVEGVKQGRKSLEKTEKEVRSKENFERSEEELLASPKETEESDNVVESRISDHGSKQQMTNELLDEDAAPVNVSTSQESDHISISSDNIEKKNSQEKIASTPEEEIVVVNDIEMEKLEIEEPEKIAESSDNLAKSKEILPAVLKSSVEAEAIEEAVSKSTVEENESGNIADSSVEPVTNLDDSSNEIDVDGEAEATSADPPIQKDENETITVPDDELKSNVAVIQEDDIITVQDDDLDLEVKTINESKNREESDEIETGINLCDSDSDVSFKKNDVKYVYKSPVKKPRRIRSFGTTSDDNSFMIEGNYLQQIKSKVDDSDVVVISDGGESNKEEENIAYTNNQSLSNVEEMNRSIPIEGEKQNEDQNNSRCLNKDIKNENKANSSTKSLRKRSLDNNSISLKGLVKAGDDVEKNLSGRMHQVVDLFCAGIANTSDVSINISLECVGQLSDSEGDKDDLKTEKQKGSKRRKLCLDEIDDYLGKDRSIGNESIVEHSPKKSCENKVYSARKEPTSTVSDEIVESPKNASAENEISKSAKKKKKRRSKNKETNENITSPKKSTKTPNNSFEIAYESKASPSKKGPHTPDVSYEKSSKLSASINEKEKTTSAKKKRKSSVNEDASTSSELFNPDVVKSSSKVSFSLDNNKSPKKKNRRSINDRSDVTPESGEDRERKISTAKKVPLTPYKQLLKKKTEKATGDTTEESSDEERNDDSSLSQSHDSKIYASFFGLPFEDNDDGDITWTPSDDEKSDETTLNDSELADDSFIDKDELEQSDKEKPSNVEEKKKAQNEYVSSSNDDVFYSDKEEEKIAKTKKRKLFRLSSYNVSQQFASTESEGSPSKKQKSKKNKIPEVVKVADLVQEKTQTKKKLNYSFESENIENIVPETSEVKKEVGSKKSRKRKHVNIEQDSINMALENTNNDKPKKKKKGKVCNLLYGPTSVTSGIEVSKKHIKPSTKNSANDWEVK